MMENDVSILIISCMVLPWLGVTMINCWFRHFREVLLGLPCRGLLKSKCRKSNYADLVRLFVEPYKFNTEIAPDRHELQRMSKKLSESFREHAEKWSHEASQVQLSLKSMLPSSDIAHRLS